MHLFACSSPHPSCLHLHLHPFLAGAGQDAPAPGLRLGGPQTLIFCEDLG